MARPTKHPHERRSAHLIARATVVERAHAEQQARIAGFADLSDYIRHRVLDHSVPTPNARRMVDPGLVTELNRLALELSAIGNNANQLARDANSGRAPKIAWEGVVDTITQLGEKVTAALEKVVLRDP